MTSSTNRSASARGGRNKAGNENQHPEPVEMEIALQVADAVVRLSSNMSSTHRQRLAESARFRALLTDSVVDALLLAGEPEKLSDFNHMVGDGVGEVRTVSEGLNALSSATYPQRLEEWAGPSVGATALHRDLGIARSTLQVWRQKKAVIGLLKGLKNEVFPLAQFVDGRPVRGLDSILEAIPQPRVAWLWLITPHPELTGETPLSRLRGGHTREVTDLARADYGQP